MDHLLGQTSTTLGMGRGLPETQLDVLRRLPERMPCNQPPALSHSTGISLAKHSRRACVLTCTRPKTASCDTSMSAAGTTRQPCPGQRSRFSRSRSSATVMGWSGEEDMGVMDWGSGHTCRASRRCSLRTRRVRMISQV
jgi:hypothetical protein